MTLVIVPGYGDRTDYIEFLTRNWPKKYGVEPEIIVFGWEGKDEDYDKHWAEFFDKVKKLDKFSILGISAGASAALRCLVELPTKINSVVTLCGPASDKFLNPNTLTHKYPVLKRAFETFEIKNVDRTKILTLRPLFDTVVPPKSAQIDGAKDRRMILAFHSTSIVLGLSLYSSVIADFVNA